MRGQFNGIGNSMPFPDATGGVVGAAAMMGTNASDLNYFEGQLPYASPMGLEASQSSFRNNGFGSFAATSSTFPEVVTPSMLSSSYGGDTFPPMTPGASFD